MSIYYSLSPTTFGKIPKGGEENYTYFKSKESSIHDFFESVAVKGHAWSSQFKGSYRKSSNFLMTSVVAIDVDNKAGDAQLSLDELFEHSFYKRFGMGYYTSPSHTNKKHKFRVLFRFESPVNDYKEFEYITHFLRIQFEAADKGALDAARKFNGNINSIYDFNEVRYLSDEFVDKIICFMRQKEEKSIRKAEEATKQRRLDNDDSFNERFLAHTYNVWDVNCHRNDWMLFGWAMKNEGFMLDDFISVTHERDHSEALGIWNSSKPISFGYCINYLKKLSFDTIQVLYKARNSVQRKPKKSLPICVYLDDLPSSGKSHWFMSTITAQSKMFIALPSESFQLEYASMLSAYNTRVITYRDTRGQQTVTDLIQRAIDDNINIIIATHAALCNCIPEELFKSLSDYDLVIDENFFGELHKPFVLKDKHKEFMGPDGGLARACKITSYEFYDLIEKGDDDAFEELKRTSSKTCVKDNKATHFWSSIEYTHRKTTLHTKGKSKKEFLFMSSFRLELLTHFKSFLFMSACITKSIVFHALSKHFTMQKKRLRSDREPADFSLLHIGIVTYDSWSFTQSIRKKGMFINPDASEDQKFHGAQEHVQWCMEQFGYHDIKWEKKNLSPIGRLSNNGDTYKNDYNKVKLFRAFGQNEGIPREDDPMYWGTKVPINSAGSNKYTHIRGYAFVACLNPSPIENAFYEYMYPDYEHGIVGNWIWTDRIGLPALQGTTRMCIRVPGNRKKCWAIFFDQCTAHFVRDCLRCEPVIDVIPNASQYTLIIPKREYTKGTELTAHFKNGKPKLSDEEKKLRKRERDRIKAAEKRKQKK